MEAQASAVRVTVLTKKPDINIPAQLYKLYDRKWRINVQFAPHSSTPHVLQFSQEMSSILFARCSCATSAVRVASSVMETRGAAVAAAGARRALLYGHRIKLSVPRSNLCYAGARTRAISTTRRQASTLSGEGLASSSAASGARQTNSTADAAGKFAQSLSKKPSGNKAVAAWLFGTAGAVAVMVTVGGITRMTKSGLSMTDWKVQGSLPPSSEVSTCC